MKYRVEKNPNGLHVEVWETAERQAAILEALRSCQSKQCACPLAQAGKLDGLALENDNEHIVLELTARLGQDLDDQAVKECLARTLGAASRRRPRID